MNIFIHLMLCRRTDDALTFHLSFFPSFSHFAEGMHASHSLRKYAQKIHFDMKISSQYMCDVNEIRRGVKMWSHTMSRCNESEWEMRTRDKDERWKFVHLLVYSKQSVGGSSNWNRIRSSRAVECYAICSREHASLGYRIANESCKSYFVSKLETNRIILCWMLCCGFDGVQLSEKYQLEAATQLCQNWIYYYFYAIEMRSNCVTAGHIR